MTRRLLAFLAGAALLVALGIGSIGLALVAPIGMWVAYAVLRERGRSYTRRAGWLGAVLACSLVMADFFASAMLRMPDGYIDSVRHQAELRREKPPSAIEQALSRVSSASPPPAAVAEKTRELVRSKAFMWWTMIMTVSVGSAILGLLAGSVGWAATTLVLIGITGRGSKPISG
jgi:hypothetical protein